MSICKKCEIEKECKIKEQFKEVKACVLFKDKK